MSLSKNLNLLWMLLCCGPISAATPAEEKLFKALMPHELLVAGSNLVRVHHVRLQGYFEGNPSNKVRLVQLKEAVNACVTRYKTAGRDVRLQTDWPDNLLSSREDIYYAENRSIRYSTVIGYGLNPADCSLMENVSRTADLVSSKGFCDVDLALKTAEGSCSADGHASAAVGRRRLDSASGSDEALKQLARDPRMAAAVASIQNALASSKTATGKTRVILGLECDVWEQPAAPGGGTACYTRKGSFIPSREVGHQAEAGMLLDFDSKYGFKIKAVGAKLDTNVTQAVFSPYTQPGFTLSSSIKGRK
jgi:hypothetical protein